MINMTDMTWQEFDQRKNEAVIIVPIGSLEQHGPHLPLATDTIIATSLAELLARKVNGLVAPAISYGYKSLPASGGGPLFPGTIDLNGLTLIDLVGDIIQELIIDGVKKILILNCHYENEAFIIEAVDNVTKQMRGDAQVLVANWWDQISEKTISKVFDEVPFPGWALEHAAITETSLILEFAPDLVHLDRLQEESFTPPNYHLYPIPEGLVPASGLLATARSSSKKKGELMVEEIIYGLEKIIAQIWSVRL